MLTNVKNTQQRPSKENLRRKTPPFLIFARKDPEKEKGMPFSEFDMCGNFVERTPGEKASEKKIDN